MLVPPLFQFDLRFAVFFLTFSSFFPQNFSEGLKKAIAPTDDWGPVEPENRKGRYALHTPTTEVFTINGKDNPAFQMEENRK